MAHRTLRWFALFALAIVLAASGTALAKKHKEKPLKSIPGGASQKWACEQIAEYACDLSKRCEPDRSKRHCAKVRDRCSEIKDRPSRSATEDDVSVCAQAVGNLGCKDITFDNTAGVNFDLKKLETCKSVVQDNPLPAPKGTPDAEDEDKADSKDSKDGKSSDDGDE